MSDTGPRRRLGPIRLYRDSENGIVRGVAAGIADYFGIHVWLVRCCMLGGLFLFAVPTLVGYLILGAVLPVTPEHLYKTEDEARFWRDVRTEPMRTFSALRHKFRELEQRLRSLEACVTSREFRLNREINDLER